jgi:hypothetical protein
MLSCTLTACRLFIRLAKDPERKARHIVERKSGLAPEL